MSNILLSLLSSNNVTSKVFENITPHDWTQLYKEAGAHNTSALVWDAIQQTLSDGKTSSLQQLSTAQKIQWALSVEKIERKYLNQVQVIEKLASFFAEHNIMIMVLKGYGLSLNYPIPNHRPCSDVDVWFFEERRTAGGGVHRECVHEKADNLLRKHFNITIDEDKHHHTVFCLDGVMVENHYDFLNVHSHRSNRVIEKSLQQLVQQDMEDVNINTARIYLPSPDFHVLFMLRHAAAHFAAERVVIRHLLDWRYYIEKYTSKIDWLQLYEIAKQMNMYRFLNCMNAICIDKLGLPKDCVPEFTRDAKLEKRVWEEVLQPEFSEAKPHNVGYIKSWIYMFRRWWAHRWKHKIVYNEGLLLTFFVQVWSHLLKPKSLKFK